MKRILLFAVTILVFGVKSFSQTVSVSELLLKTKCKDFACYNSFIIKKKFAYEKTINSGYGTLYLFSTIKFIDDGIESIDTKNQSSFHLQTTGSVSTGINTSSANYFSILSDQMTMLGFTASETENPDNATVRTWYSSKKYPKISILVTISKLSKTGVGSWTNYDLTVSRDR